MLNRLFSSRRGRMAALFVIATALAAILLSAALSPVRVMRVSGRGDPYPHRPPRRRGNRHADPLL